MRISEEELLTLLGVKEAENYALRRDLGEALRQLDEARELIRGLETARTAESAGREEN